MYNIVSLKTATMNRTTTNEDATVRRETIMKFHNKVVMFSCNNLQSTTACAFIIAHWKLFRFIIFIIIISVVCHATELVYELHTNTQSHMHKLLYYNIITASLVVVLLYITYIHVVPIAYIFIRGLSFFFFCAHICTIQNSFTFYILCRSVESDFVAIMRTNT